MDDYRPLAAIIAVAIARAWMRHEDRARARPPASVQPWGDGRVGPPLAGSLTRIDWLLAIGSVMVMVSVIAMDILFITR